MKKNKVIIGGRYRHYKGNEYVVLAIGRNSENHNEELIVYQSLYTDKEFGKNPIWIRPKKMFLEKVTTSDKKNSSFRVAKIINNIKVSSKFQSQIRQGIK